MNFDDFVAYQTIKSTGNQAELMDFFERKNGDFLPASLLVEKARLIQVTNSDIYGLSDAEKALLDAISIDESCISAYLELGCFYYAVYGDNHRAREVFRKGIERLDLLKEELNTEYLKSLTDD